jgi:PAS domain S-box-containing protein
MRFLRNLPLKRKLTTITMLISCVALLLACATFAIYEQASVRRAMARDFAIVADMFDDNVASGLAFNDVTSMEQTLKTLSADSHILGACVYDRDGKIVARYQRTDRNVGFTFPGAQPTSQRFAESRLDSFHDITLDGEVIGVVYIGADLGELRDRAWSYVFIVAALLVACSVVAFLMASRMQKVISQPIVDLARTAATVAADKNYSVRAVKQSEDEVGHLIDGFNEMLSQIQQQDRALQAANDTLESRVAERTRELQLEIAERQRSEEAVRESNQRFEIVTRATTDVIWDWNMGNGTLWWNENFQAIFGYPADEVGSDVESWKSRIHPDDCRGVFKNLQDAIDSGGHLWSGEYRFRRHDGTYAFVLDRGYLLCDDQGRPARMIGAIQDISDRKQTEAALDAMHKQLLETSRQAGMAEVATGVLHNVGNVLNSVNVSATLIADKVRTTKATNVARIANLMGERSADLGVFITSDPKGKQLPGYIRQLADHLTAEQTALLSELDLLKKNVEHIKDIVAMQQSYAKVSGVAEKVNVADLVEDTLRLNAGALARHKVRVIREFGPEVPEIMTDKHKVLQILVNLVRNAKYACDESDQPDKRLTVRVTNGDDRVRIAVADNGVGIPAENLTRIFNHGFTTRKDGHGFGLHSGALAAREIGGALRVHSEGPGHGAVFTLELPLQLNGAAHG